MDIDDIETISALSVGALASELLHFSAFDNSLEKIGMIAPFLSYSDMAQAPDYKPSFIPSIVSGAIDKYDLPDLIALQNQKKVLIVNPLTPTGDIISKQGQLDELLEYPLQVFTNVGVPNKLQSVTGINNEDILNQLLSWLQ